MSPVNPEERQIPEPPQSVTTARAGGILMLTALPYVAVHLMTLWGRGDIGFLDMLTSISTGDGVDRSYLIGLSMLGCGSCVVAGALIEAICVAITEFRNRGRLRDP